MGSTLQIRQILPLPDWCLVGNERMNPNESLLGGHSLIPY